MLESRGFSIIATNYRITSKGERIAEIDIVAEKDNETYAIEVKSGKANLTSIRQIYANARLAGYKPILICKKSDVATREAAGKLGVELLEFSEYHLLLEPEELEAIVKKCMEEVVEAYGLLPSPPLDDASLEVLRALRRAEDFSHAAAALGVDEKELGRTLSELSKRGILPSRSLSFKDLKKYCMSVLARHEMLTKLEKIERDIEELKNNFS